MYIYILAIYSSRSCHRLDHHYHVPLSLALAPLALSIAPFHLRISLPWRLLLSECYFWNGIYRTTFGNRTKIVSNSPQYWKIFSILESSIVFELRSSALMSSQACENYFTEKKKFQMILCPVNKCKAIFGQGNLI